MSQDIDATAIRHIDVEDDEVPMSLSQPLHVSTPVAASPIDRSKDPSPNRSASRRGSSWSSAMRTFGTSSLQRLSAAL